ncbi:MAG TPA: EscU/YscU/HrcU family type III secretion system export apparatus switch protein [Acidimicrobiales bacterium]|nr:EscU/YscU/HrcU family type III secretion system export apparatus switch protein [Acidimicrobiales bacterium]
MSDKGQRTEKPTPKRKREARREGRVAKSAEIGQWVTVLALVTLLPSLGQRASHLVIGFMNTATNAMATPDPASSVALIGAGLWTAVEAAGPIVGVIALAALAVNLGQVGIRFTPGALGFDMKKINPWSGIKKIMSPNGVWDLSKMLLRLTILVLVGYTSTRHLVADLMGSGTLPLATTLSLAASTLLGLVRIVGLCALLLALGDYAFQRRRFNESMKMTKDEVRREFRETEGSPEVRREIRRRRRSLTRMQMMAAVANASVVVVNPTHFAVALAYDRERDGAPRVVAKGEDDIAYVIRTEAISRRIPVIENPPVARALYAACTVGEEIPPKLYETVARLLAFVYRLTPAARALVDVHHAAF